MHKATANGGDNKCMNIYEVLKAVGFGNMPPARTLSISSYTGPISISRCCLQGFNLVRRVSSVSLQRYRISPLTVVGLLVPYCRLSPNFTEGASSGRVRTLTASALVSAPNLILSIN